MLRLIPVGVRGGHGFPSADPHGCHKNQCGRLHKNLLRLWNAIDGPNLPANVKTAMRLQGRDGGAPRAPMPESSPEQTARIAEALGAASAVAVFTPASVTPAS